MKPKSYSPFDGLAHIKVDPPGNRPGALGLTHDKARLLIDSLHKTGVLDKLEMDHVWVLEAWAKSQRLKITVERIDAASNGRYQHRIRLGDVVQDIPIVPDQVQAQIDRSFGQLRVAIATTREAADRAEKCLTMYPTRPGAAAAAVLNALAWGHANATSGIESAFAAAEDAHVIARIIASEKPQ